ncbi:MAG TPA: hypothetical protein VFZ34_17870 [Blastocatellia bacterium]|nr:hypothetical protein [Blastocatellia bacterium]
MKKLLSTIRNIFIWTYERGTWQYDLLVILIIATVFLVPSQFFGDRDRPLRTPNEEVRRWSIEPNKINSFATRSGKVERLKDDPREVVQLYLREVIRPDIEVADCIVETDPRGMVTGYSVWFQ